jgi:hypothetical protein
MLVTGMAVMAMGVSTVRAQEAAEAALPAAAPKNVSATFSLDFNSHFISYGNDVWGLGNSWDFNEATFNPSAQVTFADVVGPLDLFVGTWWDVNDNAASSIGGELQEVDVWFGGSFNIERFTVTALYQAWIYGGDVEEIVDATVGFDDSGLIMEDFALNPYATFHIRTAEGAAATAGDAHDTGTVLVIGIAPAWTIVQSETYPVTFKLPVAAGFFLDTGFYDSSTVNTPTTSDSGFGYVSIGAVISVPLAFVPESYGAWEFHTGVTWYHTEHDVIPGNPDQDFLTGNVGISVGF